MASGPDHTVVNEVRLREDGTLEAGEMATVRRVDDTTFEIAPMRTGTVRLPNPLDMHGACDEFGGQDAAPKERLGE